MELQDVLQSRRSIRKYTEEPVSKEEIDLLMHAAMSGPSACNKTPWEFYVVTDEAVLEKLRNAMQDAESRLGSNTPILVFSDQTVTDEKLSVIAPSLMRYQKQYFEHFDYRSILLQNVVTGGAMMVNRALARLALECVDPSRVIMHDWWMAVVAARFGEIVYIDEPLGAYRQHGSNSVGAKNVESLAHILHKLGHTREIERTLKDKKAQASVFMRTYAPKLEEEDRAFLGQFARRRSGPVFYLKNRALVHGFFRLAGMIVLG